MKQNFWKNEIVTGKTPFFVIGLFCTPILVVLTLASDRAVLYGNVVFSILVLSNKKRYSNFFKKTCFKVKALKKFPVIVTQNMPLSQTEGYFKNA